MRIRITNGDVELGAGLLDTPAARELAARLPLTLEFRDFAGSERIADLEDRLDVSGEPDGATPHLGDLAYYAPWGNLALFYRDGAYADGLVRLGTVDDGDHRIRDLSGRFVAEIAG